VRVELGGNVLIGTTTDNGQQLQVYQVGTQLGLYGGAADYATFAVSADGALTITTVDADAALADITLSPDGHVNVNSELQVNGAIAAATVTITASADNTDVSGVNTLWINANAAAVIVGGLTGGVVGQWLFVSVIDHTNNVTLEHLEGVAATQELYMHDSADETLDDYGGWTLVCDGSDWHDISHARHV